MAGRPVRPTVSVVCPFHGSRREGREVIARLSEIELGDGDELILVDNTPDGRLAGAESGQVRVIAAPEQQSSYFARNSGVLASSGEWVLFLDSDTVPEPGVVGGYLEGTPGDRVGILAGSVRGSGDQPELIARYARSRRHIEPEFHLEGPIAPAAPTANLMVRRETWDAVGGFHEGVRSGADLDFCWRAASLGWRLEPRPAARVAHEHPVTLGGLMRKTWRHAAGRLWLGRLHPGSFARPRIGRGLARGLAGTVVWILLLRFERAMFKALDGIWIVVDHLGYLLGDNRAESDRRPRNPAGGDESPGDRLLVMTGAFPARSETFVTAEVVGFGDLGWQVRVESTNRPGNPDLDVLRRTHPVYLGDDPPREKARSLAWLATRHPIRCLRDRFDRRRWAREEEAWPLAALAPMIRRLALDPVDHVHVHFAGRAALSAMRAGRILGIPYSLTAHAYDVFQHPQNLVEKVERSAFTVSASRYTLEHIERELPPESGSRLEVVNSGVDAEHFRRSGPQPDEPRVVAVGRLVEKKGFSDLIEAMPRLLDRIPDAELQIIGDGPEGDSLRHQVSSLGLGERVRFERVWGPEGIRAALQEAAVFCLPSVIAADGDRDSMPLVVLEAMAMEVPVVSSDEVGLPEVVRPPWGTTVPGRDPRALADALESTLSMPPAERGRMGAAAREFILAEATVEANLRRLDQLIRGSAGSSAPRSS